MYSRYHNSPDHPMTLPENYSGCAFSSRGSTKSDNTTAPLPHRIDVAKPTPPSDTNPQSTMPPPPRPILLPAPTDAPREDAKPYSSPQEPKEADPKNSVNTSPIHGLLGGLGRSLPFSHGFGFDELLILGLILLLANNDPDNDLILWLALLLFCG